MEIVKIESEKKRYLDLLLLGDEEERMIDRYLQRGDMYAAFEDGQPVAVIVVTDEGEGTVEIKNLAVLPERQGRGIGRSMIEFVKNAYRGRADKLILGTGDSPATTGFYRRCGFVFSHRVPDFFTENYSRPIIDGGVLLRDMVYFKMDI